MNKPFSCENPSICLYMPKEALDMEVYHNLQLEWGILLQKIINQRQNIHEREEEHGDDKKITLKFRESLGQMSGSKKDASKPCPQEHRGTVNVWLQDEKLGQPLAFDFLSKSRNTSNNSHAQREEDCRISMKHFLNFPTSCGERIRRPQETMGRIASWLATVTFSLCLLSITLSKPLAEPQGPHSLLLAIIGMFNFTFFVSAASVMLLVGARFTHMQITVLLFSFVTPFLA
ncbi:hypothetical protein VNO77_09151 [Canavalia gladiata]|uniref:PGG domain-containing protein n=1 Tax=Canavalia gladiata TaxID=3824 RepID=A0AAN9MAJ4_CANGL